MIKKKVESEQEERKALNAAKNIAKGKSTVINQVEEEVANKIKEEIPLEVARNKLNEDNIMKKK